MEYSKKMKDDFRERLKKVINKKIQTTMIYPLSQFEMVFGYLWGDERPDNELTQDERTNRNKWKQLRNNILNNGNQQCRNANVELDMHEVVWNRYQTEFIPHNSLKNSDEISPAPGSYREE